MNWFDDNSEQEQPNTHFERHVRYDVHRLACPPPLSKLVSISLVFRLLLDNLLSVLLGRLLEECPACVSPCHRVFQQLQRHRRKQKTAAMLPMLDLTRNDRNREMICMKYKLTYARTANQSSQPKFLTTLIRQ